MPCCTLLVRESIVEIKGINSKTALRTSGYSDHALMCTAFRLFFVTKQIPSSHNRREYYEYMYLVRVQYIYCCHDEYTRNLCRRFTSTHILIACITWGLNFKQYRRQWSGPPKNNWNIRISGHKQNRFSTETKNYWQYNSIIPVLHGQRQQRPFFPLTS